MAQKVVFIFFSILRIQPLYPPSKVDPPHSRDPVNIRGIMGV